MKRSTCLPPLRGGIKGGVGALHQVLALSRKNAPVSRGALIISTSHNPHEHPVVAPHVSHFKHVPFRTSVKLAHSGQASPS